MNINDKVWVRLTEAGVKLWKERYPNDKGYDSGRWIQTQMWCLMQLLGPKIQLWEPEPYIVDNEIATEKPKELSGFTPPKAPVVNPALPPDGRLTRTEIFLRLVDSACRKPDGLGKDYNQRQSIFGHLFEQAVHIFYMWGGK